VTQRFGSNAGLIGYKKYCSALHIWLTF